MEGISSITCEFSNYLFYRNFLFLHISMNIFMLFLTIYHMSRGLSYFYMRNSQLEIRQCNTIYAMRASDGRFISIENEFSNYLFYRNFFFSHYIMNIFMLFLTIYYMSWGLSYFYENLQLEIRKCNTIYSKRASHGMFSHQ